MLLVPNKNPYVSGETAIFDSLIRSGEERSHITLSFNLRIFLIGCLVEHMGDPDITHCVLAIGFLESSRQTGVMREISLKRTGDASLILAGLFPERALRLNVSSTYFRFMGQASYTSLAAHLEVGTAIERGKLYNEVAQGFIALERVLSSARAKATNEWDAFLRFRTRIN